VLAIRRAYENGVDIGRLQYIEAHATSTAVGDLTELKALAESLEGQLPAGKKIPIGAVKANIGHTLEAAGLAGLVKTLLAIEHKTIPQQIHITRLNPGLDWEKAPLVVPTSNTAWPEFEDGHPRRAAVNSFGIGGLNVHVVVDEYQPQAASSVAVRRSTSPIQAVPPQEPIAVVGCLLGAVAVGSRSEVRGSVRSVGRAGRL
jgi:hybrid polyketide synthase/nonribosomal peptide synthetase FtdB